MFYFERNKTSLQAAMRYVGEFNPFTPDGWNLLFEVFTAPSPAFAGHPVLVMGGGFGLGALQKVMDSLMSPAEQARQHEITSLLEQSAPHGTKPHRRWPVPK